MNTIISLKNVSVTRDGNRILNNVSFDIKKGENWAIIGRNGSGKSFLLRIISTLIYPSEGSAEIYGNTLGQTNIWDLRHKIGVVSDLLQREYSGKVKVRDVVASGFFSSIGLYENLTDEQIIKIDEIIDKLGIRHIANREYKNLSQGEQKKVLIGRSLVFDPELLILDEPTTGLDIAAREDFLETVSKLIKHGHNVILVTHHIEEIVPKINKILFMVNGSVYNYGDKKKMMTNKYLNEVLSIKSKIKKKKNRYWLKLY